MCRRSPSFPTCLGNNCYLIIAVSWLIVSSSGTRNFDLSSNPRCFSFLRRSIINWGWEREGRREGEREGGREGREGGREVGGGRWGRRGREERKGQKQRSFRVSGWQLCSLSKAKLVRHIKYTKHVYLGVFYGIFKWVVLLGPTWGVHGHNRAWDMGPQVTQCVSHYFPEVLFCVGKMSTVTSGYDSPGLYEDAFL